MDIRGLGLTAAELSKLDKERLSFPDQILQRTASIDTAGVIEPDEPVV